RLGRDEQPVAPAGDGLAEDLLGQAVGIDISGVEERRAGLERDVDEARRLLELCIAPGPKKFAAAAKGRGPEAKDRHFEAGPAEQTVFHADSHPNFSSRMRPESPHSLRPALPCR